MHQSISELEQLAPQIRRDILRMVHACQSGHPGGSLGCVEFFLALYGRLMKHHPDFDMDGRDEDLFFLSNGHISPVWYSVLARFAYFPVEELSTFRRLNSRLQGHPATEEKLPGIRVASGSLGQGLSVACGAALSKKLNGENRRVFVLMGDGEQQEGQVWEAAMFAAHNRIDNLIATIDLNGQQIDGPVDKVLSLLNLRSKYEAFGWDVMEISEGNSLPAVISGMEEAIFRSGKGKPVMVLLKTEMGFGVDFMMHSHKWHGVAPNDEQLSNALSQLSSVLEDYPV
jgi:transketolase